MEALKFSLKKEWLEGKRTKKLMVLAIAAMFFSLLDPVMLKLTPYLLQELSGIDIGNAISLTQVAQLKDYNQDMYQIFSIVLVVIVGNTWLNEVKNETLVIPVSKGVSLSAIMLGKISMYTLFINGLMIIAYSVNYYYSGVIFGFEVGYYQVLISALLMGLFYSFCIVFMITFSPIIASYPGIIFMTLLIVFGGQFLAALLKIDRFTPFALVSEASMFPRIMSNQIYVTIVSGLILAIVLYTIGITVATKKEIVKYR